MEVHQDARERVLDVAERLFASRGYTGVTLRDIAAEVGIKHTTLYHHVPGGKEELFIEVTERNLKRHQQGLKAALVGKEQNVRSQLFAVSDWLLSQPPMDVVRLMYTDMPTIDATQAHRLSQMVLESIILPILAVLEEAQQRGEIHHHNLGLVAGGVLGMIESLHAVPTNALIDSRETMAHELIDVLLSGLRPRA